MIWHEIGLAESSRGAFLLLRVSGHECVRVLLLRGFDATERRGDSVWMEREACGIPVPLDAELDGRVLDAILQSARIEPREFEALLAEVSPAA